MKYMIGYISSKLHVPEHTRMKQSVKAGTHATVSTRLETCASPPYDSWIESDTTAEEQSNPFQWRKVCRVRG